MLFSDFWSYVSVAVAFVMRVSTSLGDDCRAIKFASFVDGQALENHVIETMKATSSELCEVQCFIENKCVSYNFGPSDTGEGHICELNNSTDPKHLKPRRLFTYRATENACQSSPCLNNATCQTGFTNKKFRCLCPAGFKGDLCEIVSFDLHFTDKTKSDYVIHHSLGITETFTICFRMRTTNTDLDEWSIVSYGTIREDNEILIYLYSDCRLGIVINDKVRKTQASANHGKWHHICVTWENQAGSWKLYKDGIEETSGTGLEAGHVIENNGILVIGQDQDSLGGGFNARQSFVGDLTDLNMWNKVLPAQEILNISKSCSGGWGNVKKWSDFTVGIKGNVKVVSPSDCTA